MDKLQKLLNFKEEIEARGGSLTKSQKARVFDLMYNQGLGPKTVENSGKSGN